MEESEKKKDPQHWGEEAEDVDATALAPLPHLHREFEGQLSGDSRRRSLFSGHHRESSSTKTQRPCSILAAVPPEKPADLQQPRPPPENSPGLVVGVEGRTSDSSLLLLLPLLLLLRQLELSFLWPCGAGAFLHCRLLQLPNFCGQRWWDGAAHQLHGALAPNLLPKDPRVECEGHPSPQQHWQHWKRMLCLAVR